MNDWKPAGAKGQPSVEELAARHHQREAPANIPAPITPGLPLSGPTGPNGVRVPVNTTGTGWNGSLEGL
ncbi:MAG: hypothetical protein ACRD3Q_08035 [Terriglobales bacterium]